MKRVHSSASVRALIEKQAERQKQMMEEGSSGRPPAVAMGFSDKTPRTTLADVPEQSETKLVNLPRPVIAVNSARHAGPVHDASKLPFLYRNPAM